MMDPFTKCPHCGAQAVRDKTVYLRALNAHLKPVGETETVQEHECQNCGWIASTPVATR